MNVDFETYYELCRTLINVIGMDEVSEADKAGLIVLLSANFELLGKSYWSDKSDVTREVIE